MKHRRAWSAAVDTAVRPCGGNETTITLDLPPPPSVNRTRRTRLDAWHTRGRAADMTVEALMFSLRERGLEALAEADTRRRLSQLSDAQAIEVGKRLQHLRPNIGRGPWSLDEIKQLFMARP